MRFRRAWLLTASSYLAMFFLGVGATILGAAARNIGLTPFRIGLLIAVQNLGYMLSVLAAGALADRVEKSRLLLAGSLLLGVSFLLFYHWRDYLLNMAIMFTIGAGMGFYEGAADAMLLDIHRVRQGVHITVNHFFVTFGSLLITLYLVFLQMNWRRSLVESAVVVLLLAVLFGLVRTGAGRRGAGGLFAGFVLLWRRKALVVLLLAAVVCAVGLEVGTVGILTTFLMETKGYDQVGSKLALILFISGIAAGRLALGFIADRRRLLPLILFLFFLAFLLSAALYFTELPPVALDVLMFLFGVSVSALLPLQITLAGFLYPDIAGTALGAVKLGIPLGGILIPSALSLLSRYLSFRFSLALFPLICLAGCLAMLARRRRMRLRPGA